MIGVESGSQVVRDHMRKVFTDIDLDYTIEECLKNKIQCILLFMVGYPTETEEDFEDTLKILYRYKNYAKNISLRVSWRVGIVGSGTELEAEMTSVGYEIDHNNEWSTKHVDILVSARRYKQFKYVAECLGYEMPEKQSDETLNSAVDLYPKLSAVEIEQERAFRDGQRLRASKRAELEAWKPSQESEL